MLGERPDVLRLLLAFRRVRLLFRRILLREVAELVENGVNDDDRLVSEVSVYEDGDNIQARLRLAQFVEDFGDFIEDAVPSKLYE